MKANLYTIEPISNLHVGRGGVNLGVVDNLIQRDIVTDLPNINASSLKGALREYFEKSENKTNVFNIFGSPVKGDKRSPGSFRFFDANLLAIPVRSDKVPFFLATCPMVIKDFIKKIEVFGVEIGPLTEQMKKLAGIDQPMVVFKESEKEAFVEDLEVKTTYFDVKSLFPLSLFGNYPLLLVSDKQFMTLCDDNHLPVIARNYLNNGKSENLFYEQVIPRFSIFYFVAVDTVSDGSALELNGKLIQIGANASVGYGFCKFKQICPSNK